MHTIREHNLPRFLVDQMLGEVTRWLRILGYDTEYSTDLTDHELIERSRIEKRVLLTGDQELHRRALKENVECLLLRPGRLVSKLAMVAKIHQLDLILDPAESRCPICNGQLRETSSLEAMKDKVPLKVQAANKEFWICTGCGKVYWKGGHWNRITKTIDEVKSLLTQKNEAAC